MNRRCDHERLTWGCDPCRERVKTDQELDRCFQCADDDCLLDGIDHLVEELDWNPGFADTCVWWSTLTIRDVLRKLRDTNGPDWRAQCREMRRDHDVEPEPVRHALLREAWRRRSELAQTVTGRNA